MVGMTQTVMIFHISELLTKVSTFKYSTGFCKTPLLSFFSMLVLKTSRFHQCLISLIMKSIVSRFVVTLSRKKQVIRSWHGGGGTGECKRVETVMWNFDMGIRSLESQLSAMRNLQGLKLVSECQCLWWMMCICRHIPLWLLMQDKRGEEDGGKMLTWNLILWEGTVCVCGIFVYCATYMRDSTYVIYI